MPLLNDDVQLGEEGFDELFLLTAFSHGVREFDFVPPIIKPLSVPIEPWVTSTLPASFGWSLTIIGLLVSTAMPASGGWLILAIGLLALTISWPAERVISSPMVSTS